MAPRHDALQGILRHGCGSAVMQAPESTVCVSWRRHRSGEAMALTRRVAGAASGTRVR